MKFDIENCLHLDFSERYMVGEGRHRIVFRMGNFAVKILKPYFKKSYGSLKIPFPTKPYTAIKFGFIDYNTFEYKCYTGFIERVPLEYRNRFAHIHGVWEVKGKSISVSDLIMNSDGSLSQPLSQYPRINDSSFWEEIDSLEELLTKENIPIMDIRGENILVKEEDGKRTPVMIDFKRYGRTTYPMQLWLLSEAKQISKMRRRFERLKKLNLS